MVQKTANGSTVESQNRCHVLSIQLEEGLEKHIRAWLVGNNLKDVTHCVTHIYALKEKQLPQCNLVNSNVVNCIKEILITCLIIFLLMLLHYRNMFLLSGKLIKNLIGLVNFEVIAALQRMDHLFLTALAS